MPRRIKIPTVGGSYKHESLPFNCQETINLFPERGKQSKSSAILRRTPGLKLALTLSNGTGAIRGMYEASNGRAFIVRGTALVEIDADNVETSRGTFSSTYFKDYGRVSMIDNGVDLVIASESATSMYTLTFSDNSFALLSAVSAPGNTPVVDFSHTYIFGFDPDSAVLGTFRHCVAGDATTWNAGDQYNADGSPDRLVSLKVINGQLCLFGSKSHEYWYINGETTLGGKWSRVPGTTKNIGIASAHAVSNIDGRLFWLGSNADGENIVWSSGEGYSAVRISNRAIETIIGGFSSVDDAWSYSFEYEGHFFFCLTFQTGNKTFLYDITENEWVNWSYRDTTTGEQGRHRANSHMFFNRKNYVGDYANGNVYTLDKATYTDNGAPIVWERYFAHFENLKEIICWYSLQLDVLTGSALLGKASQPDGISVSSITTSATTATVTTASAHKFATGDSITIKGASPESYNGKKTITVTGTTTFTYTVPNNIDGRGTISVTDGDETVTGTDTIFDLDDDIIVGTVLVWADGPETFESGTIASITSNVSVELSSGVSSTTADVAYTYNLVTPATGTITATDQAPTGTNPKIQLRWSDDGGRTYGNWVQMTIGNRGEYNTRVVEYMLGDSRDRVYHIRSSEPIPMSIQDSTIAEVEAGAY